MYDILFSNRNKIVADLIKLGDCMGRSIRENVFLFTVDPMDNEVSYLTEGDKIITGNYSIKEDISLNNIVISECEDAFKGNKFESKINESVGHFLGNLYNDEMSNANGSFNGILNLWEERAKYDKVCVKLQEKVEKLSTVEDIMGTTEFARFAEISEGLVEFLKENKTKIQGIPEISNAVKLSYTISEAFNLPLQDVNSLTTYTLNEATTGSIYDLICQQELVKKELLETKRNFSTVWANNTSVNNLTSYLISESDDEERLCELIAESIKEIPYFAMASKKQLTETFERMLSLRNLSVATADVKKFSSQIFELKKPVREEIASMLSNKYGIQVQNLKEDFSFKSLVQTQIVIVESLAKLSPKGSVQKSILLEVSKMLKGKSGVESIDVSNFLHSIFEDAGYKGLITEGMGRYMNFDKVAGDLDRISGMLKLIMQKAASGGMSPEDGAKQEAPEMGAEGGQPEVEGEMGADVQDDGNYSSDTDMDVPNANPGLPQDMPTDDFPGDTGAEEQDQEIPQGQEGLEGEEQFDEMPQEDPQGAGGPVEISPEDLMGNLSELEGLISDLKMEMGGGDEEVIPGEEEEEIEGELQ